MFQLFWRASTGPEETHRQGDVHCNLHAGTALSVFRARLKVEFDLTLKSVNASQLLNRGESGQAGPVLCEQQRE